DVDDKGTNQVQFLHSFLTHLYSGNYPKKNARNGVAFNTLIDWLVDCKFYDPPRKHGETNTAMPFTPSYLVRSVSGQVAAEFQRMYANGTHELYKKVKTMKEKGTLGVSFDIRIQDDISAVENFIFLNKLTNNSRRIIPLTTSQQPFVSFSERELASFFWKRDPLKERLQQLALQDNTHATSITDIDTWIRGKEPGFIIKNFVCAVAPQGLTSRQRKKAGHRACVKMLSLDQIRRHLDVVKSPLLVPAQYKEKGYVLRGSIRTNGFRVQLLGFKLRELQDVRYRRLDENRLPSRLTSTVGGVDYFLQEIRNVITSKEDVERLWPGTRVEDIKTLTLDGGQVCVIGAFAHLPHELSKSRNDIEPVKSESAMEGIVAKNQEPALIAAQDPAFTITTQELALTATGQEPTTTPVDSPRSVFFNLAVKSKAVYQPNFRFRRWLEGEKEAISDGEQKSIGDIETHLPPLKGQGASVINHVRELERDEKRLLEFYSGSDNQYNRHVWDMKRAMFNEFQLIADRLFNIVGGSIGLQRDPSNSVLIAVGLGKFSTGSGLSSLHSHFLEYFVQT
ncbi:hypothetical protein BGZ58_004848, partial [Dissophora ornata]